MSGKQFNNNLTSRLVHSPKIWGKKYDLKYNQNQI